MQHTKQKSHLTVFLLGVLLTAGTMGSITAVLGTRVVFDATARERREETILESLAKRRARREKRQATVPRTSSLVTANLSKRWEVSLGQGMLEYPRLGITAPIGKPSLTEWRNRNWGALENQLQFGLLHGVVAYPHSPDLGKEGNLIIAGHSSAPTKEVQESPYREIFASLPDAQAGDRIEVRSERGNVFTYEVYDTEIVPPSRTDILLQEQNVSELTLFTCYPVGTVAERFVVHAKLVPGKMVGDDRQNDAATVSQGKRS